MSGTPCREARRAVVAGADASAHLSRCAPCRAFAARLAAVDGSLGAAAEESRIAPLAPALRVRILAAAAPAPATARPRGRILDFLLRAAAVAAVLVGAAWYAPEPLLAAEDGLVVFTPPDLGIDRALAARVEALATLAEAAPAELPQGPLPLAVCAAVFLAAGWAAAGTRRRA